MFAPSTVGHSQPEPTPETSPQPAASGPTSSNPDIEIVRDPQADAAIRNAAAIRLLQSNDPHVRSCVAQLLDPANNEQAAALTLLERAAEVSSLGSWMLAPCLSLITSESIAPARRTAAVLAIGSIRTRNAIKALIPLLEDSTRPELREPAVRALARLTGKSDLGADVRRWRDWFAQIEWLPELEWRAVQTQLLAEAADRAVRERDRSTNMLLDSLRDRFLEAPTSELRSGMLVQFLRHEVAAVRRLGVQLTRQELANARSIDPVVSTAVEGLLHDPSREFRRAGAELLGILAPTDGGQAIAAALVREEDPEVVAPLLRSAARNPSAELVGVVVRWLSGPKSCREPALGAAAALYAKGLLNEPQDIRTLRDALRGIPLEDLSPGTNGTLAMYYTLGDDADRAKVQALLSSQDAIRKLAAADLLANDPSALNALLAAAMNDSALLSAATRAVSLHLATIDGYEAIARLPAPSEAKRREALLKVAAELPPGELLAAARNTEDPAFREVLLTRLTETQELQTFGVWRSARLTPHPSVISGLLLLAETRLALGQPAGALEVLNDLQPVSHLISGEFNALRTVTLLWLNRIDEAQQCKGDAAAWLDGLERSIELPHAIAIVRAIESRFESLSDSDGERLRQLRDRLQRG